MIEITLKEVREKILKMSMADMAKFLGISRQAYWYKENGKREIKARELIAICDLADINPRIIKL